ncbi:hypothetical protein KQ51_00966 [Candidatus Izimaplasma bacterium HR1]|jgi:cell division protein FtsL|uniref:hypothetical protein n=1 Tax=Candidatus Izimoplasma sp. HR1 TaxID=1541959 RepID=UPI0004F74879|nr:hypothetical protein KQ51_00966 [Candidatus Izimaplasma bacterium HR1]
MSAIIIVWFFLLLIVSAIIVVAYRMIYKQNMNKALEGNATQGLIDIGQLLKTLTFIALLVLSIITLTKINALQAQVNNLENQVNNQTTSLRSSINSIRSLNDSYIQSQELIQSSGYELVDMNDELFVYDIEFTLLELDTGADVYIVIEEGINIEKTLLVSESLSYHAAINLDRYDYTISVLIEGTTTTQKDLFNIEVEEDVDQIISAYMLPGINESTDREFVIIQVANIFKDIEEFTISTVNFMVYDEEDVLVRNSTLTSPTDMEALLSQYITADEEYEINNNEQDIDFYAIVIDLDESSWSDLKTVVTITLENGNIIIRNLYF